MIQQFLVLGVYQRNTDDEPSEIIYDIIVNGEVVKSVKRRMTAIIELAAAIDDLIGT